MFSEYCQKSLASDRESTQTMENIEEMVNNAQTLLSFYPEDIFKYSNEQVTILKGNLTGELYIEFIKVN